LGAQNRPVSIVVLTYNHLAYTRQCFEHLFANTDDFQLIVVDNASTDDTRAYLHGLEERHDNVRIIFNESNLGFAGGCNRGAASAQHGLLCFLNNDTIPLPGWLDALRHAFDKENRVGVVGAKLMWPNLLIQHAGVAFRPVETPQLYFVPFHRFMGAPHDLPEANVPTEVAGVTAGCMLTSRTVWTRVCGMDEGFVTGNFEDVDFNLKVRKSGLRILYQPEARLIHYEHGSSEGMEASAHKAMNFHRLASRWTPELARGLWTVGA
jgi:GT2 family glycosyltransferase